MLNIVEDINSKSVSSGKAIVSSLFTRNPVIPKEFMLRQLPSDKNEIPSNGIITDPTTFAGIGLDSDLSDHLTEKLNIAKPTTVQVRAIPLLLGPSEDKPGEGRDVDIVVQAETGSGKTLTYLLPIVHRLLTLSTVDPENPRPIPFSRSVGTLAIILAPTRELARQILDVLEKLLNIPTCKQAGKRRIHWIVPGVVIGGDKKKSEKERLRKGTNILVSTPGRLLDHLKNTQSFNVDNLKWLVLDEADRLLDLGFEEDLKSIISILDERSKACLDKNTIKIKSPVWPKRRLNILCSATLRDNVKRLAGQSLTEPLFVRGSGLVQSAKTIDQTEDGAEDQEDEQFSTPNQLKQMYIPTPSKLRLVTLAAILKSAFAKRFGQQQQGKVVVFHSCCDSVDFYHKIFAQTGKVVEVEEESDEDEFKSKFKKKNANFSKIKNKDEAPATEAKKKPEPTFEVSEVIPKAALFKLHGNLPQNIRTQTYFEFCKAESGVLFCTDVAARGLHLPDVSLIVQFDPPTDLKDYVHRVGRTARLGRAGEAYLLLLPSEIEYLDILKGQGLQPEGVKLEKILSSLSPKGVEYEQAATELQNEFERFVLSDPNRLLLARKSYSASIRAYATHTATERHIFHIKKLHLGHWAKSFALREAPTNVGDANKRTAKAKSVIKKKRNIKNDQIKKGKDLKRKLDSSEFAIGLVSGPTTKKGKKK
ncbi:ATP-dependent RNA helicase dbp7 [Basidiobolus ranarum]|uniref:ATP-dependent RNA helicase n=1 Tax=Basidiobolus ranarum TaxID=34480 RepID=A0ABR2VWI4_9FUNG